jgi:hypothetical protein
MNRICWLMIVAALGLLGACKNNDEKARELGFNNAEEQNFANSKGFTTKDELDKYFEIEEREKKRLDEESRQNEIEAANKVISCKMYTPPYRVRDYAGHIVFKVNYLSETFTLLNAESNSEAGVYDCQRAHCFMEDILNKTYKFNSSEQPVRFKTDGRLGAIFSIDRNSGLITVNATSFVYHSAQGSCQEVDLRSKF